MKNYKLLLLIFLFCVACNTKQKQFEEQKRIKDSITKDSIYKEYLKVKIDTVNAYFKRIVFADKKNMLTFDPINLLEGEDTKIFSHNNNENFIVVNPETTTSTLEVIPNADIYIFNDDNIINKADIDDISDIPTNSLIQIFIQNKKVLFLKQLKID
ncbi:MAG: hypothetical protein MJ211_11245 [Bacteroidales bacterium]|nr:hypothetical protein [Bacteroidales bacterium]